MEREPNTLYVLSLSYGKDSIAAIEACKQLGYPLDAIVHAEVWFNDEIPADLPPMVEFKSYADKVIKERYGIDVIHTCAMRKVDEETVEKNTYEYQFYRERTAKVESTLKHIPNEKYMQGFPSIPPGNWCNGELKRKSLTKSNLLNAICNGGLVRETYCRQFYSVCESKRSNTIGQLGYDGKRTRLYGFPVQCGSWCKKLKEYSLRETNIRRFVLQALQEQHEQAVCGGYTASRADDSLSVKTNSKPGYWTAFTGIYGFPMRGETGATHSNAVFSSTRLAQGAKINIVQYLGIAADEPERIERHTKKGFILPLVDIGWDEAYCRKWCEENNLLSPIYTTATRGGCWFCHNQSVNQLRLLRRNYPDLWTHLLRLDKDSPVTFHADGHTVMDFEKRFAAEDEGRIPKDKPFRWKMVLGGD